MPGDAPAAAECGLERQLDAHGVPPTIRAHQYGYGEGVAGFVLLEFTPNELGWKAINRRGLVVDEGRMNKSGEIVFSNERTRPEDGHGRLLPAQDATQTSTTASITTGTTERATTDTTTSATNGYDREHGAFRRWQSGFANDDLARPRRTAIASDPADAGRAQG